MWRFIGNGAAHGNVQFLTKPRGQGLRIGGAIGCVRHAPIAHGPRAPGFVNQTFTRNQLAHAGSDRFRGRNAVNEIEVVEKGLGRDFIAPAGQGRMGGHGVHGAAEDQPAAGCLGIGKRLHSSAVDGGQRPPVAVSTIATDTWPAKHCNTVAPCRRHPSIKALA